jgi:hypothetical protein
MSKPLPVTMAGLFLFIYMTFPGMLLVDSGDVSALNILNLLFPHVVKAPGYGELEFLVRSVCRERRPDRLSWTAPLLSVQDRLFQRVLRRSRRGRFAGFFVFRSPCGEAGRG